jgi:hypothetical protein
MLAYTGKTQSGVRPSASVRIQRFFLLPRRSSYLMVLD